MVDGIVNKKDPNPAEYIGEQLSLNDENVQILYQYVTSGIGGKRITKFATEKEVNITSFNNKEKLEYAFQFAEPEDFEFTGEYNDKKQKIYTISDNNVLKCMKLYFGPNVTFEHENQIVYPFNFYINKMNEGTLTYNTERAGYDAVFGSRYDYEAHKSLIEPVYGQLISALVQPNGTVILQERVVYTELRTANGGYTIDIYRDPEKKDKIESKENLTDETLKQVQINVSDYSPTAIIEYTFGHNGQTLYFDSSRIIL